ncbi:MAG: peptidase S8 [Lachnospiraceae bacterium]|nr:peptidase S8 [Lachnospiraceae bacterium]
MDNELVLAELYNTGTDPRSINGFRFMFKNIDLAVISLTNEMLCSGLIKKIYPLSTIESSIKNARERLRIDCAIEKGITGKGIGIAIMDTGISPIADFKGRIAVFKDFINNHLSPYDDNGHGTHVSGIACGNGASSSGIYRGVAPASHIISLKILDKYGKGNSLAALNGIQWIIENHKRYNIKVINISAGSADKSINIPLVKAAESAVKNGISVIAADNNSAFLSSVTSPGISPLVLTVGSASNFPSVRTFRSGRSYYKKPDIYAPGEDIISCLSPDYRFEDRYSSRKNIINKNYIKMSGSSMATPIISGIAALIYEKYPRISPAELKSIITSNLCDGTEIPLPDVRKIFNV